MVIGSLLLPLILVGLVKAQDMDVDYYYLDFLFQLSCCPSPTCATEGPPEACLDFPCCSGTQVSESAEMAALQAIRDHTAVVSAGDCCAAPSCSGSGATDGIPACGLAVPCCNSHLLQKQLNEFHESAADQSAVNAPRKDQVSALNANRAQKAQVSAAQYNPLRQLVHIAQHGCCPTCPANPCFFSAPCCDDQQLS